MKAPSVKSVRCAKICARSLVKNTRLILFGRGFSYPLFWSSRLICQVRSSACSISMVEKSACAKVCEPRSPRGGEFLSSPPDEVPRTLFQEDHAAVIRRRTAANRKRGYSGQFPKGVQRGIQSIQQGECLGGRAISVEHAALGVSGPLEQGVVTVAKCLLKRDTRIGDLCQSLVLESRRDVTGASQDRNTCAEECTKFGPSGLAIQGR